MKLFWLCKSMILIKTSEDDLIICGRAVFCRSTIKRGLWFYRDVLVCVAVWWFSYSSDVMNNFQRAANWVLINLNKPPYENEMPSCIRHYIQHNPLNLSFYRWILHKMMSCCITCRFGNLVLSSALIAYHLTCLDWLTDILQYDLAIKKKKTSYNKIKICLKNISHLILNILFTRFTLQIYDVCVHDCSLLKFKHINLSG